MSLDLNSLSAALHSIKISNGTYDLLIDSSGYVTIANTTFAATQSGTWDIGTLGTITNVVHVDDNSGSLTVDATDLDIRDLSSGTDSVSAVQSGTWDIGTLGTITNVVHVDDNSGSLTVDATDLDIRDLSHSQDSVKVGDGTDFLAVNADGSINVLGSIATTPEAYDTWQVSAVSVTSSATQLDATPLSGRINCVIQNLGAQDIYIKNDNTVTTANGLLVAKGFSQEIALDDNATIYAVTSSGTSDVRLAEYSA